MVLPARGTLKRFFFACSPPLRMASGTSFALPSPAPTWPWPSPTTTRALKLKRRPPFTTLATRLMVTTFSLNSRPCGSMRSMGASGISASFLLELEAGLAGSLGEGLHPAVVQESVAVEDHLGDGLL